MTQERSAPSCPLADNHQNGGCADRSTSCSTHISHVDERIAELTQLKTQLTELRQRCLSARPTPRTAAFCMAGEMQVEERQERHTHLG